MKYSRKPLVLDICRAKPVGDEVDNIDEVHAILFNTPFEANHFYSRNSKTCYTRNNLSQFALGKQIRSHSRAFGVSQI
jgi:hypothetical protein